MKQRFFLILSLFFLVGCGCGPTKPLYSVEGMVRDKDSAVIYIFVQKENRIPLSKLSQVFKRISYKIASSELSIYSVDINHSQVRLVDSFDLPAAVKYDSSVTLPGWAQSALYFKVSGCVKQHCLGHSRVSVQYMLDSVSGVQRISEPPAADNLKRGKIAPSFRLAEEKNYLRAYWESDVLRLISDKTTKGFIDWLRFSTTSGEFELLNKPGEKKE